MYICEKALSGECTVKCEHSYKHTVIIIDGNDWCRSTSATCAEMGDMHVRCQRCEPEIFIEPEEMQL
jgi:hypothetical protein